LEIFVRACSTLVKVEQDLAKKFEAVEGSQYLVEVELALTKIFKLLKAVSIFEDFVRACSSIKY
jgi:hypothetical protein